METSTNLGFYLPSSNSDDIADINQISDNFRNLDEYIPNMFREVKGDIRAKQDVLVSGENIKSINGESLLGEGNLELAVEVDQVYNAESENAQSGIAVAEALGWDVIADITLDETNCNVNSVHIYLPTDTALKYTQYYFYCEITADKALTSVQCPFYNIGYTRLQAANIGETQRMFANMTWYDDTITSTYRDFSKYVNFDDTKTLNCTIWKVNKTELSSGLRFSLYLGNSQVYPIGTKFLVLGRA
jgi:hypothetical protein